MYKNVRGGREGLKNIHLITSSPGQRADSEVLINMQGSFLVFFGHGDLRRVFHSQRRAK